MKRYNHKDRISDITIAEKFKLVLSLWVSQFVYLRNDEYVYLRIPKDIVDKF